jgi:hypothetical protein
MALSGQFFILDKKQSLMAGKETNPKSWVRSDHNLMI